MRGERRGEEKRTSRKWRGRESNRANPGARKKGEAEQRREIRASSFVGFAFFAFFSELQASTCSSFFPLLTFHPYPRNN